MKAIQDQEDLLSLKAQGSQSTTKVSPLSRHCTQHSTNGNDFEGSLCCVVYNDLTREEKRPGVWGWGWLICLVLGEVFGVSSDNVPRGVKWLHGADSGSQEPVWQRAGNENQRGRMWRPQQFCSVSLKLDRTIDPIERELPDVGGTIHHS